MPIALAMWCDPESRAFDGVGRDVVAGLALAGDRSLTAPIAQLLVPLGTLLPLGHAELRAAIALSIPAALATFVVARRIARVSFASGPWTSSAIVLSFGAIVGVLLGAAPPEAAVVSLAIALFQGSSLGSRESRSALLRLRRVPVSLGIVGVLAPVVILAVARDASAWLTLGKAFHLPGTRSSPLDPAMWRAAIATFVLALFARLLSRAPTSEERASAWIATACIGCAILFASPAFVAIAAASAAPLAAAAAGAIALVVDRKVASGRRAVAALVPALCLGLAARAFEVEVGRFRLPVSAAAAHDVAAIMTTGTSPPRAVLLLEDETALVSFARERVLHGLRPDLRVLPAQTLLAGGAAKMATRTLAEVPGANDPLRALLARGVIDVADVAPLAQRVPVLDQLPAARVRLVARHAASTGGPLLLALERVDPSDRRLRRLVIDRRMAALAGALAIRPGSDRVRRALRVDATREARALSTALDRDGALAALARARALGAPDDRIEKWIARVNAKQTLDAEPICEDD